MGIPFTLIGVGCVALFLGLLNGDITTLHDISKFGGCFLIAVGLLWSARVASSRRQEERLVRLREGLPQAEPLGRDAAHH